MQFKFIKNLYKKSAVLFVAFLASVFVLTGFLAPPKAEALTEAQAERRAQKYCVDEQGAAGSAKEACLESFKAGATARAMPSWCQDKDSDDICQKAYNEGKKADTESRDPNKRSGGDQKEAQEFCKEQIGGRKQECERGYIAGLKGEQSPCPNGGAGQACREGFNEGKKQRRQNEPRRSDCDDSANPAACKREFDKCDEIQGPNVQESIRNCKREVLEKYPDDSGTDGDKTVDCDTTFSSPLSWIACPIIDMGVDMTDGVFQNIIVPMLENVPVTANPESGTYIAWQQFRLIANVLLVGSLLVIVYSQARGGK